jgi:hypothetical protein
MRYGVDTSLALRDQRLLAQHLHHALNTSINRLLHEQVHGMLSRDGLLKIGVLTILYMIYTNRLSKFPQ